MVCLGGHGVGNAQGNPPARCQPMSVTHLPPGRRQLAGCAASSPCQPRKREAGCVYIPFQWIKTESSRLVPK